FFIWFLFAEKGKVGKRKKIAVRRESIESSFSFGFFAEKEKQAKEKRDCRSAGKVWNHLFHLILFAEKRKVGKRKKIAVRQGKHGIIFFIWFLFAEKGKAGKREKRLPFGRESVEFSFSFDSSC
ncbi:MAG: hypothetical protein ACLTTB_06565, partial [Ruminococcus sp.]